jgi:cobalt-zinc-cadmium efflux system outer membrane protein
MKWIVWVFCVPSLSAQMQLSLEDAVRIALEASGVLEASRQRAASAAGAREQALRGTNPRLVLQSENTRPYSPFVYWRDTDNFAYLQHTFETSGRRLKRGDAAGATVARTEAERDVLASEIRARVKRAYWAAAGAQLAEQWLAEDLHNFGGVVEYHRKRVAEGAMAEADLLRIQLEESRLRLAVSSARLTSERSRIELLREMSQTAFPEVRLADSVETLRPASKGTVDDALSRRPEIAASESGIAEARAQLRLQEAIAKPNVDVLFGYKRAAGFDAVLGGVQVELPVSNRNQGGILQAGAQIKMAEASRAAARARVAAEVEAATRAVEIRHKEAESIVRPMREQAAEASRIAREAYQIGGIDLLRLLDAERARIETQLSYFATMTAYQMAVAELEVALGLP